MRIQNFLPAGIFLAGIVSLIAAPAFAQDDHDDHDDYEAAQPLWEIGIAGGTAYSPDYPASDEYGIDVLAFPYLVYRGDIFRLGEDSIAKAVLLETERLEFDIGFDASFDADSDGNDARRGMPDLDFLGEIGPQLTIELGEYQNGELELSLPVGAVFSMDFGDLHHRGYVFNPELSYEREGPFEAVFMSVELGAGFATEELHDYFYQVDPRFATPSRAAFDADGGYLGSELGIGFFYGLTERVQFFTELQAAYHGGAANDDSPLYGDDVTFEVGAGLVWSLYQSDARASAR